MYETKNKLKKYLQYPSYGIQNIFLIYRTAMKQILFGATPHRNIV